MKLIAADIGGTKSWLCLCDIDLGLDSAFSARHAKVQYEQIYQSADFSDFSELLTHFLQNAGLHNALALDVMCLALPGVIEQGHARLTNLDWVLDAKKLQDDYNIAKVIFTNDFQAAAMGVLTLEKQDYIVLNPAQSDEKGVTVVTGAGTGLGMAWMIGAENPVQLFATEGGHCDYAPTNDEQIKLLKFLLRQHSHVSYERILSGDGLEQLYTFVNAEVTGVSAHIPASQVNELANNGDVSAQRAMGLFVEIYAAYIGNLALLYKPRGGIYIAGGVAKHIQPWMQGETFINSYLHKGRMQQLVAKIPVYLVTNNRLGLQGAIQLVGIR